MSESFSPKVDIARLANSYVRTEDGNKIQLGRVWQKKPAILIFLRHFACIACRAHAQQVWKAKEKYEATGGSLVFIGNGEAEYIQHFKSDLNLDGALVLTDPSLESFRAAGFHHGFFYVVQFASALNAVKLAKGGARQAAYKKEAGTHWQLGGIVVVKETGEIPYHYISESLGDFPEEPHFDKIISDEKNRADSDTGVLY